MAGAGRVLFGVTERVGRIFTYVRNRVGSQGGRAGVGTSCLEGISSVGGPEGTYWLVETAQGVTRVTSGQLGSCGVGEVHTHGCGGLQVQPGGAGDEPSNTDICPRGISEHSQVQLRDLPAPRHGLAVDKRDVAALKIWDLDPLPMDYDDGVAQAENMAKAFKSATCPNCGGDHAVCDCLVPRDVSKTGPCSLCLGGRNETLGVHHETACRAGPGVHTETFAIHQSATITRMRTTQLSLKASAGRRARNGNGGGAAGGVAGGPAQ